MAFKPQGLHWIGLGWLILTVALACSGEGLSGSFQQLLGESQLEFTTPEGFQPLSPMANPVLPYEHAIRTDDAKLEVRYAIRPLGRVKTHSDDSHNSAPEPNLRFNRLFASLAEQLASGGDTPRREYNREQAKELFNADWAAAAVFDVNPQFCPDYRQGLLVAIHKNGRADAYMVYLFNTYPEVKQRVHTTLSALKFSN